jgi:hypothetical protein
MKPMNPVILCNDGFTMSVQASSFHYCSPREDYPHNEYETVEVGFPNRVPLGDLKNYREDPDASYTDTVYPFVPHYVVRDEIALHGGIESGKMPE